MQTIKEIFSPINWTLFKSYASWAAIMGFTFILALIIGLKLGNKNVSVGMVTPVQPKPKTKKKKSKASDVAQTLGIEKKDPPVDGEPPVQEEFDDEINKGQAQEPQNDGNLESQPKSQKVAPAPKAPEKVSPFKIISAVIGGISTGIAQSESTEKNGYDNSKAILPKDSEDKEDKKKQTENPQTKAEVSKDNASNRESDKGDNSSSENELSAAEQLKALLPRKKKDSSPSED